MRSANDDISEIAGKVDKIVRDMQTVREQNRRDFPLMASYLKLLERFSPRAIFAEENGRRVGKVPQ